MKHPRFELTSDQTLRLAELRDMLVKSIPEVISDRAEYPTAQYSCGGTCSAACSPGCGSGCAFACYYTCKGGCETGCGVCGSGCAPNCWFTCLGSYA